MDRTYLERISVRTAMAFGVCVTIGIWIYASYSFTRTMGVVHDEAAAVAARYSQAQELLSTIRTQILLSSVRVRDALLTQDAAATAANREQVEESYRVIAMAIEDYEPVVRTETPNQQFAELRAELDRFHQASSAVFAEVSGRSPAEIRELLNRNLMPPREAALLISDEIQSLNRQAYIKQQAEIATIYQAAERNSRQQLTIALVLSFAVLLLSGAYASKLDSRLRMQLGRDIRLAKELHSTAGQLADVQFGLRRSVARDLNGEIGELLNEIGVRLASARRAAESGGDPLTPIDESQALTTKALKTLALFENE